MLFFFFKHETKAVTFQRKPKESGRQLDFYFLCQNVVCCPFKTESCAVSCIFRNKASHQCLLSFFSSSSPTAASQLRPSFLPSHPCHLYCLLCPFHFSFPQTPFLLFPFALIFCSCLLLLLFILSAICLSALLSFSILSATRHYTCCPLIYSFSSFLNGLCSLT